MLKKHPLLTKNPIDRFLIQFSQFTEFFTIYIKKKIVTSSIYFEKNKNMIVRFFMMKRGRYNRPFLHISAMVLVSIGLVFSPLIAGTYPVFSQSSSATSSLESSQKQSIIVGDNVFSTDISQKPRDKIITYTIQKGDTLSSIGRKFGISVETIKWANNLTSDNLVVGDDLSILPVTGVAYKVLSGETIYSIAKKLDTDPQKIVDFPFNDFANPETFSLVAGQTLIVPDGVKPSEQSTYVRPRLAVIAVGPTSVSSAGFAWPVRGGISQYPSWYHMAVDITADVGTPIVASNNGVVGRVILGVWDGGYGNNVYIDSGNGYQTHYAHMMNVIVSPGQSVIAGKTVIGTVGLTGRTTGAHLHFEIIQNGALVNPLGFLQ